MALTRLVPGVAAILTEMGKIVNIQTPETASPVTT
jgi:hypothetical protein